MVENRVRGGPFGILPGQGPPNVPPGILGVLARKYKKPFKLTALLPKKGSVVLATPDGKQGVSLELVEFAINTVGDLASFQSVLQMGAMPYPALGLQVLNIIADMLGLFEEGA